jgi:hypothetical protein
LITDYTSLQAAIATWLAATGDVEVTGNADTFVQLAEQRINRGAEGAYPSPPLRLQAMETVNAAFAVAGEYTNVPTDFLEMRSLVYPTNPLQWVPLLSEEQLVALFGGVTGTNFAAAIVGLQLRIFPIVTASTTFQLTYVAKVPALSDAAPTNWLLTNAPGVYLYGALLEAVGIGVADPAMVQQWYAAYLSAASGLQASDKRSRFAGGTLQVHSAQVTP